MDAKLISVFLFLSFSEGSVLRFPEVTRDQMGAYLCIASNGIPPKRSKRFTLTVLCKFLFEYYCW